MEIIKAFTTNDMHMNITIGGTIQNPLFRASDIGNILDTTSINVIIRDYDKNDKILLPVKTLGGEQMVSFLTESGLYKILFRSRKPIAEKFQNWVCEVIKEIRINGQYQLEKQIKEKDDVIQATQQ